MILSPPNLPVGTVILYTTGHCGQMTKFLTHLTIKLSSRRLYLCACGKLQTLVKYKKSLLLNKVIFLRQQPLSPWWSTTCLTVVSVSGCSWPFEPNFSQLRVTVWLHALVLIIVLGICSCLETAPVDIHDLCNSMTLFLRSTLKSLDFAIALCVGLTSKYRQANPEKLLSFMITNRKLKALALAC